jgi:hypothetical protein
MAQRPPHLPGCEAPASRAPGAGRTAASTEDCATGHDARTLVGEIAHIEAAKPTWFEDEVNAGDAAGRDEQRVLGQQDWLGTLRAAGLVGENWRPSRGTWCHVNDGHRCRSLLEKAIDDKFTANLIPHDRHPGIYGAVFCASPGGGYRPPAVMPNSLPRSYLVAGTLEPFFLENAARWAVALRDAGADVVMTERVGSHGDAFWREEFPLMVAWAFGR